ncbi:MAG: hypothetical protein AAF402_03795 [Pseudomonadota bacterium]
MRYVHPFRLAVSILLVFFALTGAAHAIVQSVNVSPSLQTLRAVLRVDISIPDGANQRALSIAQALTPGRRTPQLNVPRANLNWSVRCDPPATAQSIQSPIRLDGIQVGSNGAVQTACSLTSGSAVEMITLPASATRQIAQQLLARRLIEVTARGRFTQRFQIEIDREFNDGSTAVIQNSDTALIQLDVTVVASIAEEQIIPNRSILVAVQPSSSAGGGAVLRTAGSLRVNWRAAIRNTGAGETLNIQSSRIDFVDDRRNSLGNSAMILRDIYRPARNPSSQIFLDLAESISVPQSVLLRARQRGSAGIRLIRQFSDGRRQVSAELRFSLDSQTTGPLSINRLDLSFANGSRQNIAAVETPLRAIARIRFDGRGQLRGRWEYARVYPGGLPVFRPIVRSASGQLDGNSRFLYAPVYVSTFLNRQKSAEIHSPFLPTREPGQYLVRLAITQPDLSVESPAILYSVTAVSGNLFGDSTVEQLQLLSPASGEVVGTDTPLSWSGSARASVYQYEFLSGPESSPILRAGAAVPGSRLTSRSTLLVDEKLRSGETYWLRVVGFDSEGNRVAETKMKSIVWQ